MAYSGSIQKAPLDEWLRERAMLCCTARFTGDEHEMKQVFSHKRGWLAECAIVRCTTSTR